MVADYDICVLQVKEMQLTVATVLDKVRLLEETGQRSPKMGFSEGMFACMVFLSVFAVCVCV